MDNSESITGSSVGDPKGLHEGDGELRQAEKLRADAMESAPLKNKAKKAKKDDGKEVSPCKT